MADRLAPADFERLFEAAPDLYLVLKPDAPRYTIVGASDAYLRATLIERASVMGRGIFEVFPDNPADVEATGVHNLRASLDRVLAERRPDPMAVQKYDVRRADGEGFEERYWSPVNTPVAGADGQVAFIIHRVEDVTGFVKRNALHQTLADDIRRMEAEIVRGGQRLQEVNVRLRATNEEVLARGELNLRTLFDLMPQLGWTALPDGSIDFYNRRWLEYTGLTTEELVGTGWHKVHDPAILPSVVEAWRAAVDKGEPLEMEFPLRRADGVFRWFLTRVVPLRDVRGAVTRWVGINTDIHDRKLASAVNEQRLRLLIDSIHDYAVFMLDEKGRVQTWNPGAERFKQYRADEIIGRHFSIFYPPEVAASGKPDRELVQAAATGRFEEEGWRVRKDGTRFWANVVISAVRDAEGRLVGFSKVTRDLTERKDAEQERVRLAQAQEAIRLRDEFLSIASHELRTPLTSMRLLTSGMERSLGLGRAPLDLHKLHERVHTLDQQLERLARLIYDLLDVSRMSAGGLTLQLAEVDLASVVRDAVEKLRPDLAAAGCKLLLDVEGQVVGRWDRLRAERVVMNLMVNALKYGAGQPVEVSARAEAGRAVLRVRDHGIGIAPGDQQRIFERFHRGVSAEHFGGLGLGLWIVKQFIEAMGGAVAVESKPGEGALFTVELPLERPGAIA